jgi:hypothetical protein
VRGAFRVGPLDLIRSHQFESTDAFAVAQDRRTDAITSSIWDPCSFRLFVTRDHHRYRRTVAVGVHDLQFATDRAGEVEFLVAKRLWGLLLGNGDRRYRNNVIVVVFVCPLTAERTGQDVNGAKVETEVEVPDSAAFSTRISISFSRRRRSESIS